MVSDPQTTTDFDAIRLAFVEAGKPLEVLIMSGWADKFTPETRKAIHEGAEACRRMLRQLS